MDWSRHIEVHLRSRRLVCHVSAIPGYNCLIPCINRILDIGAHPHLLLEVYLGQGIALLSILDLSVPLVYEMVAGSDVVMPVVLDALDGVLLVEIEVLEQTVEEFVFDWHLFLSWEEAHVSISIFYLQRPCVASDVVYCVSCVWVCV